MYTIEIYNNLPGKNWQKVRTKIVAQFRYVDEAVLFAERLTKPTEGYYLRFCSPKKAGQHGAN